MSRRTAQFEREITQAELDADAARYKIGRTYRQVAVHFGVSVSTAHQMVERAVRAAAAAGGEVVKAEELAKLEALEHAAWEVLRRQHITVNNGRVIHDPRTDEPLEDDGPVLAALDRLLKVQERRARLLGLDAPVKVEGKITDATDAAIEQLVAELAQLAEAGEGAAAGPAESGTVPAGH